ncbi:surfeit locus protein 6 homolog [Trichoplusia ni]|uniref:Surfeit locus protein 6 homolog n=1 Tax=Trichoplusia ni TaxID=7111 RepID=A0A7E5VC54_TRINI|nr:surfeit locus protein 6 homolog [Trichoplusia ni]XP_026725883.1 surfeit locus protein 6 homolog [Trichoplusia ni]
MTQKKVIKMKKIKADLNKEFTFLKNVFSVMALPLQMKGENEDNLDIEIVNENGQTNDDTEMPKRARTIAELEEKLQKIKSQNNFSFKNKLQKKSLSSKLNKKIKKKERLNKTKVKPVVDAPFADMLKSQAEVKPNVNIAKPVFNNEGKLVFSKFDFANVGKKERVSKAEKDPKKILENLKQQEEKFKQLEEREETGKVKEIKEKIAWKNVLQKAEGQKVKDDPLLLKKSIKKMDQKKKQSKKQWDTRVKNVEQKKDERQKKRKENIAKKKKEKKSKIIKTSAKRGRVVI